MVIRRGRAALIHVFISCGIAAALFIAAYLVWYPGPLFESAGGRELFMVIVAVDVTLGPLITFIVFVPGKKGLEFDLVVIGTLQAAALAYGFSVLFEARPVYIVYVKDRFELVRANEISDAEMARSGDYGRLSWTGPRYVGVRFPTDPNEQFKLAISGMGGVDIQHMPRYYAPYDEARAQAVAHGRGLELLRAYNPGSAARVAELERRSDASSLSFVPLRAGKNDASVIINSRGDVVAIEPLMPWNLKD
jgi:hypothetical protein